MGVNDRKSTVSPRAELGPCMIEEGQQCRHLSCAQWAELGRAVRDGRPTMDSDWVTALVGAALGAAMDAEPRSSSSLRVRRSRASMLCLRSRRRASGRSG